MEFNDTTKTEDTLTLKKYENFTKDEMIEIKHFSNSDHESNARKEDSDKTQQKDERYDNPFREEKTEINNSIIEMTESSEKRDSKHDSTNSSSNSRENYSPMKIDFMALEENHEYDTFGDNNTVYRKYKLRKRTSKPVVEYQIDEFEEVKDIKKRISNIEPELNTCTFCSMEFSNKQGYNNHMRIHKNKSSTYKCAQCFQTFTENNDLISHKEIHNDESFFICNKCPVAFTNNCDYLIHKASHNTKKVFTCEECEQTYSNKTSIVKHIETHFDRRTKCHLCFKMIKNYNLQSHLRNHETSYECVECGKCLVNKSDYNLHMTMHTGIKLFQCLYCGKGFANNQQRNNHTRVHTNERPYECKICFQKFKDTIGLQRHKVTHDTVKRHQCNVCGKKYFHLQQLRTHSRIHSDFSRYTCQMCGKRFPNAAGLKTHILYIHKKDRPYKCEYCNYSFIIKGQLVRHCKSKRHNNNVYGFMQKDK
uniref:C2H2-type domain-containing protein n=1 Tax=Bombyx mori TaxID=7091 RepID=A0A8R1WEM4_BOMMO|nr:zinc finger protein 660 [Bombyx mori]